jgi:hypothetical protein
VVSAEGGMWHFRFYGSELVDVKAQSGDPGHFVTVGCGWQDELHVCGITDDGAMWHTIRHLDGSWASHFESVCAQAGNPGH